MKNGTKLKKFHKPVYNIPVCLHLLFIIQWRQISRAVFPLKSVLQQIIAEMCIRDSPSPPFFRRIPRQSASLPFRREV